MGGYTGDFGTLLKVTLKIQDVFAGNRRFYIVVVQPLCEICYQAEKTYSLKAGYIAHVVPY